MSYLCNDCERSFSSKKEKRRVSGERCPWCDSTDITLEAEVGWSSEGVAG
jgi:Zn finger protein HypA/HybF involved in hydrogenase expression